MEIERDVSAFLKSQLKSCPENLKRFYSVFDDLYHKKLWHQLTVSIEEFQNDIDSLPFLIPLYTGFIVDFEKNLNQLKLVQFVSKAAKQLPFPKESLSFLAPLLEKFKEDKKEKAAYVLCSMECARYKLLDGNTDECLAAIHECEKLLDTFITINPIINASFYRVSADYYKAKAAYPQYYHHALLFLSSINISELSGLEKVERAHDLSISALLGDGLYNFGELLLHPILDALKASSYEWLRTLLFTFNSGDMDAFDAIAASPSFQKMCKTLFSSSLGFIRQKLCIMTLVESVFKRSKEERICIKFAELSKECRVPLPDVEHLVMKTLSLGLIKGRIDEIDQTVQVTWVQPRVLDKTQIKVMMTRLSNWVDGVKDWSKSLKSSVDVFAH